VSPLSISIYPSRVRYLIKTLRTPLAVQRWLDSMPYNFEPNGETIHTIHGVTRRKIAHCLEAALCAASILEQHGYPPILMDLESVDDLDHVVFLFKHGAEFGTIGKSRDPALQGRKPRFRNLRTLVQSYAAPYIDKTGRLNGYGVLDLRSLRSDRWRTSEQNVWYIEQALIKNRHERFGVSNAFYRRWHQRYLRWIHENPGESPRYFPGRHRWLTRSGGLL